MGFEKIGLFYKIGRLFFLLDFVLNYKNINHRYSFYPLIRNLIAKFVMIFLKLNSNLL